MVVRSGAEDREFILNYLEKKCKGALVGYKHALDEDKTAYFLVEISVENISAKSAREKTRKLEEEFGRIFDSDHVAVIGHEANPPKTATVEFQIHGKLPILKRLIKEKDTILYDQIAGSSLRPHLNI